MISASIPDSGAASMHARSRLVVVKLFGLDETTNHSPRGLV
jgi:hypothetical protein